MRPLVRWIVGCAAATTLALSIVPTSTALEIEGDLFWRDVADVYGVLNVDAGTPALLVQQVPVGAAAQDYAWTLSADKLTLFSSAREEPAAWEDVLSHRNSENEWDNQTYEFSAATVRIILTPSRDYGASAVFQPARAGAAAQVYPAAGTPTHVRIVDPEGDFMNVPDSAHKGSSGQAYAVPAPQGRLLEVTGRYDTHLDGHLEAAFFGWSLTVEAPQRDPMKFQTGIRTRHDPTTGFSSGTVLEYVTLYADGARVTVPPMRQDMPLYTPLLRYSGLAEYPGGSYTGTHMDLAPQGGKTMPLSGNIWLSAVEAQAFDGNYVRAWGDADWKAPAAAAAPVPVPAPSALPLLVGFAGLSLTTHLLPALGRALRGGLFVFYARLRDQEPHANPTRERIYQAIIAEPGLNLSRIVERLDIGWGTAAYHVQILKRQTRVRELRFLNRVCFFPSENPDEAKQLQTVLLRQPNYREVMTVVEAEPGLSQREVAGKTGHARQYISRLVAKMERAGLLRTEPSRMGRRYFPVPARGAPASAKPTGTPEEAVAAAPRPAAATPVAPPAFQASTSPY
jgi:MarR family protein